MFKKIIKGSAFYLGMAGTLVGFLGSESNRHAYNNLPNEVIQTRRLEETLEYMQEHEQYANLKAIYNDIINKPNVLEKMVEADIYHKNMNTYIYILYSSAALLILGTFFAFRDYKKATDDLITSIINIKTSTEKLSKQKNKIL